LPNNPDPIPISVNLFFQQLIAATVNIFPTIDAMVFVEPMRKLFQVLELKFPVNNFEKI
jgi:hypothetical protein